MNKKQLIIMWVGIGLVTLILLFPKEHRRLKSTFSQGHSIWRIPITRTKLCLIIPVITAGAIVTLNNKKNK